VFSKIIFLPITTKKHSVTRDTLRPYWTLRSIVIMPSTRNMKTHSSTLDRFINCSYQQLWSVTTITAVYTLTGQLVLYTYSHIRHIGSYICAYNFFFYYYILLCEDLRPLVYRGGDRSRVRSIKNLINRSVV